MANVLLIGATGFVGSAVLNELVSRGHKVTTVVRNIEKTRKERPRECGEGRCGKCRCHCQTG